MKQVYKIYKLYKVYKIETIAVLEQALFLLVKSCVVELHS